MEELVNYLSFTQMEATVGIKSFLWFMAKLDNFVQFVAKKKLKKLLLEVGEHTSALTASIYDPKNPSPKF